MGVLLFNEIYVHFNNGMLGNNMLYNIQHKLQIFRASNLRIDLS